MSPRLRSAASWFLLLAIGAGWPLWVAVHRAPPATGTTSQTSSSATLSAKRISPRDRSPSYRGAGRTAEGELHLPGDRVTKLDTLSWKPGQIVRASGGRARVVVPPKGLVVRADRMTFRDIDFVSEEVDSSRSGDDGVARPLVRLCGAECTFVNCSFQSPAGSPDLRVAIHWQADVSDHSADALPSGRIRLTNCVLRRVAAGIELDRRGAIALEIVNSLHLGPGPLVRVRHCPAAEEPLRLALSNVTLRDAEALLALCCPAGTVDAPAGEIGIDASGCVFAPREDGCLLSLSCDRNPRPLLEEMKWTGRGSVVSPSTAFCGWRRHDGSLHVMDDAGMSVAGLVRGQIDFAGRCDDHPASSRVVQCQAPSDDVAPPGANRAGLPPNIDGAARRPR